VIVAGDLRSAVRESVYDGVSWSMSATIAAVTFTIPPSALALMECYVMRRATDVQGA
jgi:hypothetical protein